MPRAKLSPRKRPTQARGRETVEAILKATAQVLTARGYAGTTTNHVAQRAGVSIGSLYQYFPSKDALLVALVQRHVAESAAVLAPLLAQAQDGSAGLHELLETLVRAMVALHSVNPRLHQVLFEEAPHTPEVHRELRRVEELMADAAEALVGAHPEVHVASARAAACLVVHAVEALTHHFVIHPGAQMSDEVLCRELVAMLEGYLRGAPRGMRPRP